MSENLLLANIIFSMEESFSLEDIEQELEKAGKKFDAAMISEALEIYIDNGLVNENGLDYELSLSIAG